VSRPRLEQLAADTEADAALRGATLARLRLIQESSRRADLVEGLARRVRAGDVEPVSALAAGLDETAATLRLLGCAESSELGRLAPERPARARGLWGRVWWLLTGR